MLKQYLGDSVYAELNDFGQIVLTTENGFGASNTIYLEPEVFKALVDYGAVRVIEFLKQEGFTG